MQVQIPMLLGSAAMLLLSAAAAFALRKENGRRFMVLSCLSALIAGSLFAVLSAENSAAVMRIWLLMTLYAVLAMVALRVWAAKISAACTALNTFSSAAVLGKVLTGTGESMPAATAAAIAVFAVAACILTLTVAVKR